MGFGFAGPWRRLIRDRNAQGMMAQLLAIGLTAIAIQPIIAYAPGSFLGAIAPVSVTMMMAAFVFGLSMQMILGCGSGTLINAGSGNAIALVALPLFCLGSFFRDLAGANRNRVNTTYSGESSCIVGRQGKCRRHCDRARCHRASRFSI
jgi:hypothetical protein